MNKETKNLSKENELLEKNLRKVDEEQYTNMIVYIRGSKISEYNQEVVRKDLIEMIVAGEERGDTLQEIVGDDYKVFCDEIIDVFPSKTSKEKILNGIHMILIFMYILGGISVVSSFATSIALSQDWHIYTLTWGQIISFVVIAVAATTVVKSICNDSFNEPKIKNKVLNFIVLWLIMCVIIGCIMAPMLLIKSVAITANIFVVAVICLVAFAASRIVNSKIS